MRHNSIIGVLAAAFLLLAAVTTAGAEDAATLTITPDRTEIHSDGTAVEITYTVSVAPPAGREIGVFSFRLLPSGQMTLPEKTVVDGRRLVQYLPNGLPYDPGTGEGVFQTYEYTAASRFFAAVGSSEERRMTQAADIMTIIATVPADAYGTFVLDAEFLAAPDGSGSAYASVIRTTPVTVIGPGGNTGNNVVVSDVDRPIAGAVPDGEATVFAPGEPQVTTTWWEDGKPMTGENFLPGHAYTIVIHVKTSGAAFDTDVYVNEGYTVERLGEDELILRRSFYVAPQYTSDMTEEALEAFLAQEAAPGGDSASPPGEESTPSPEESVTSPEKSAAPAWPVTAVLLAAAAAVALLAAVAIRRKKRTSSDDQQEREERV